VGKGVTLDGKDYTVVGVLPSSFVIPDKFKTDYALWVPLVTRQKGMAVIRVIGRLQPALTVPTAQAELDAIAQSALPKGFPVKISVVLSTWHDQVTENSRRSLVLILGAVGFLLLIACVNVANLMLSRATGRAREIAVRLATGASRSRIIRQLLTESALLALLGALFGLGLARSGKDLLVAFISPNLPALEPFGLDYRVLGFSLALAVVTGLAAGLAPALQSSKVSLSEVLKEASRAASDVRSGKVFRNVLIVFETALALVLLVGSGLLFRSFLRVRGIDLGFRSKNILSMTVDLTPSEYATPNVQAAFFQQLMERIEGLEGVQAVAGSSCPPLGNRETMVTPAMKVEGQTIDIPDARSTAVSPDYFRALGIPLLQGRYFTEADRATSESVAIVDESFARRYCPGEKCLGGKLASWVRRKDSLTIVGITANARDSEFLMRLEAEPHPKICLPFAQASEPYMTVLVRTAGNPKLWTAAVRSQVAGVDKNQPSHDLMTLEDLRTQSLTPRRVNMLLFGAFAALGLILALVGVYGVLSYSVSQRRHEIGVHMALGAERGDVLRVVIRQGLTVILIGVAVGIIGALALTRFLSTLLYGVKPTDPATIAAVSVLLIVVAALASVIPARRATTLDPMVALRYE
jgi:putative ABC transport system permease protein